MPAVLLPSPFLSRLWLLPLLSSATWFVTLSTLLAVWFARGRPRYPGQSNPYVAFISDIGAFELKPLFLVGASITSVTFLATISNVHRFRMYAYTQHHSRARGVASIVSVFAGFVAALSLLLMAGLDTFRFHSAHKFLLWAYFGGIGLCSILIAIVWADQILVPGRLRKWCIANSLAVVTVAGLSLAFTLVMRWHSWKTAGMLEWIVGGLGAVWIFTFVGILRFPESKEHDAERTPLLRE